MRGDRVKRPDNIKISAYCDICGAISPIVGNTQQTLARGLEQQGWEVQLSRGYPGWAICPRCRREFRSGSPAPG